jgi:hypothetical protein
MISKGVYSNLNICFAFLIFFSRILFVDSFLRKAKKMREWEMREALARGDEKDVKNAILAMSPDQVNIEQLFHNASLWNTLEFMQWMVKYFGEFGKFTAEDARSRRNSALRTACIGNHLETAQWLTMHFGLTPEDARSEDNNALQWACKLDHLSVAQWLVDYFELTPEDAGGWAYKLNFSRSDVSSLGPKSAAKLI